MFKSHLSAFSKHMRSNEQIPVKRSDADADVTNKIATTDITKHPGPPSRPKEGELTEMQLRMWDTHSEIWLELQGMICTVVNTHLPRPFWNLFKPLSNCTMKHPKIQQNGNIITLPNTACFKISQDTTCFTRLQHPLKILRQKDVQNQLEQFENLKALPDEREDTMCYLTTSQNKAMRKSTQRNSQCRLQRDFLTLGIASNLEVRKIEKENTPFAQYNLCDRAQQTDETDIQEHKMTRTPSMDNLIPQDKNFAEQINTLKSRIYHEKVLIDEVNMATLKTAQQIKGLDQDGHTGRRMRAYLICVTVESAKRETLCDIQERIQETQRDVYPTTIEETNNRKKAGKEWLQECDEINPGPSQFMVFLEWAFTPKRHQNYKRMVTKEKKKEIK